MNFAVGDKLRVDGEIYEIIGKISYRNRIDNSMWMEYRILSHQARREKWLSYDEEFREYSVSEVVRDAPTDGYHEVDRGREEVIGAWGNVDVEIGDEADFIEFEDVTEEKIISHEIWDDGKEVSVGYYLDMNEVERIGTSDGGTYATGAAYGGGSFATANTLNRGRSGSRRGVNAFLTVLIVAVICLPNLITMFETIGRSKATISKYLKKSADYTYVTSITGDQGEKADVYQSAGDIDWTSKDIIKAINGKTEEVQQNTEGGDQSVAVLTSKEYCLIYTSEDGDTLIQISTRKYAYYNDDEPYRSRSETRRYYRSFYFSRAYAGDMSSYNYSASPYDGYSGGQLDSNYNDTYSSYSDSIRQSSVGSRYSSGGGTSSGK